MSSYRKLAFVILLGASASVYTSDRKLREVPRSVTPPNPITGEAYLTHVDLNRPNNGKFKVNMGNAQALVRAREERLNVNAAKEVVQAFREAQGVKQ